MQEENCHEKRIKRHALLVLCFTCMLILLSDCSFMDFVKHAQENGEDGSANRLIAVLIMVQALADEAKYWQWQDDIGIYILHTLDDCLL